MIGPVTVALLQVLLLALVGVAVARRNVAAAVNAGGGLLLAAGAIALWLDAGSLGPALPVWVTFAGVVHAAGMLGLYESRWWWDHLTHGVSAALVAALVYAGLTVALPDRSTAVAVLTVGATLVVGVAWELAELVGRDLAERLDVEPVLVYYGRRDTLFDLVFDLVGAALVVAADVRTFLPLADRSPAATRTALVVAGAAVVVGSAAMAGALVVGGRRA